MEEEVLCGYTVTARKKRVFAVYLDLLQTFERLCREADITYWIYFGTLIGAVRHKGFIPWDDDVDIMMPRESFDRLYAMTNGEFGAEAPYFLQNARTDPDYHQTLIRFRRSDTTAVMDYDLVMLRDHPKHASYNMGMCLSIFPLDNCCEPPAVWRLRKKLAYLFLGLDYRATGPRSVRPAVSAICRAGESVIGAENVMRIIHACYRSEKPSVMVQCLDGFYPDRHYWHAEDFRETVYLPFEDITVPAPIGCDRLLTDRYGDYMRLPPPEALVGKHDCYLDPDTPYTETIRNGLDRIEQGMGHF